MAESGYVTPSTMASSGYRVVSGALDNYKTRRSSARTVYINVEPCHSCIADATECVVVAPRVKKGGKTAVITTCLGCRDAGRRCTMPKTVINLDSRGKRKARHDGANGPSERRRANGILTPPSSGRETPTDGADDEIAAPTASSTIEGTLGTPASACTDEACAHEISSLQATVALLRTQLDIKDTIIRGILSKVAPKDVEIADLRVQLEAKDDELAAKSKETAHLRRQVEDKESLLLREEVRKGISGM